MARILGMLAVAVLGVALLVAPAQASIIPVTFQFSDPDWSGTLSFDDTTGIPDFGTTIRYDIVDMTISDGVATWTEDELTNAIGALLVDTFGRAGLLSTATDTATGANLGIEVFTDDTGSMIAGTTLFTEGAAFPYLASISVASVPVPRPLWLVASGLVALGSVAWRRRPVR